MRGIKSRKSRTLTGDQMQRYIGGCSRSTAERNASQRHRHRQGHHVSVEMEENRTGQWTTECTILGSVPDPLGTVSTRPRGDRDGVNWTADCEYS